MPKFALKGSLLATTIIAGVAIAAPAYAQDASNNQPGAPVQTPPGTPVEGQQVSSPDEGPGPSPGVDQQQAPTANTNAGQTQQEIVVTGSLIPRRTTSETPSPVTVMSSESMEQRGINTVGEALQRLSANGAASIGEGWNNGNNFAAGAIAPSLRGLTVQKTLSIFDGLRMAPYPVADDAHRNFVDISTIPDGIIDRVEVLRDGASSTYGADAVAGVVNIITKKEIRGLHVNGSFGISSRGDGRERRLDVTAGYGDLDAQGFNVYLGGTYRKIDVIWARDRDFPFNTGLYSKICNSAGSCIADPARWAVLTANPDGSRTSSGFSLAPMVAPATDAGKRVGEYQLLNADCDAFNSFANTLPDKARGLNPATGIFTYAANVCSADLKELYGTIRPPTERYGLAGRATINIGSKAQAYLEGNYFHTGTFAKQPPNIYGGGNTTPPDAVAFFALQPVYVCPTGKATIGANGNPVFTGCTNPDGTPIASAHLNPNNPFAAQGQSALILGRYDLPVEITTRARSLRAAAGISGAFGGADEWNYNVEATASEVRFDRRDDNYLIPQRVADLSATGEWNFAQPWLNTKESRDYLTAGGAHKRSVSELWMANATLGRALFELPGGPLRAAVGLSYRHEAINDPSENPGNPTHPFDRYFGVNSVGAIGSRDVKSGYFEVNAPLASLGNNGFGAEIDLSGRYDKYSTGQKNFSPKVGFKVTPIREVAFRGTWSKGFRIPSFNESFGLPSTGYVTAKIDCKVYVEYCASHGNNGYVTGQYNLGRTGTGNPALDPEKSTSFTLGTILEPVRDISFTIDYFNIRVKDTIATVSAADQAAALDAYLKTGNTTAVPGVVVVPGIPDVQFPNARPLPGFVEYSFNNADEERVSGLDFGMSANHRFGGVRWSSFFEASYLIDYSIKRKSGDVEKYAGTLSPCDYTSCSGSPRLRASWQNTFDFGRATVTPTVYYTSGYDLASTDYGGVRGDCLASVGASVVTYQDGTPVRCKIGGQWNADISASFKVTNFLTVYGDVLNFLDIKPKFDPSTAYSITNYNPIFGQANIVGRFFRIGAKLDLNPPRFVAPVVEAPVVPPPAAPAAPQTITCPDGLVILANQSCPVPPPPPAPPAPAPERGL